MPQTADAALKISFTSMSLVTLVAVFRARPLPLAHETTFAFRHGPMELVKKDLPVLLFIPGDRASTGFCSLVDDFVGRGAQVIVAGASYPGTVQLPTVAHVRAEVSAICMIQSFYRMAAQISVARGLDPDRPAHLRKVTDTL